MAWNLLFSSDIGLMSLFTILFVVVIAIYMLGFAKRHMDEDQARAAREGKN